MTTLNELISQLQAIRDQHGGDCEVLKSSRGDLIEPKDPEHKGLVFVDMEDRREDVVVL